MDDDDIDQSQRQGLRNELNHRGYDESGMNSKNNKNENIATMIMTDQ